MSTELKPFYVWTVNNIDYKLKLSAGEIAKLEQKYGKNLISVMDGEMPPLAQMVELIHASMQKFHHGQALGDVYKIVDVYFDEGGSQLELFTGVVMGIFQVSGFFPKAMSAKMKEQMEKVNWSEMAGE